MAEAEEHHWPCAQCGADLRYAPGQTELKCDHCGFVQAITEEGPWSKERAFGEHDLAKGLAEDLPASASVEVRTTSCPNCGAQVTFSGANHATECPFCATPVVVDTGSQRLIKPQAVLPFALTEAKAREALTSWLGRLWFAPNGLLEYTRKGRAMAGVYAPYWTFDAKTASRYTGQRGEYYYETRTVTVNVNGRSEQRQEQVQKIRWYPASGRVARRFDDVLVVASSSLPANLSYGLEPWDLGDLKPYSPDFLAGFQAEGYTVGLKDGFVKGQEIMKRVIEDDVRADIGGDVQQITSLDTDYSDETFKHVLLPIWMAAYKYADKSYRFMVNGQTGKVQGERPYSWWKIGFAVVVVVVIGLGVLYLKDPSIFGK